MRSALSAFVAAAALLAFPALAAAAQSAAKPWWAQPPAFKPDQCEYDGQALLCKKVFSQRVIVDTAVLTVADSTCSSGSRRLRLDQTLRETIMTLASFDGHAPVYKFLLWANESAPTYELLSLTTTDLGCA